MDVIDDIVGEAHEIKKVNPYLAYGLPLHRLREFGCANSLLDLLDETALSVAQVHQLVGLIYGDLGAAVPHPSIDWQAFIQALDGAQRKDPGGNVWDPCRNRVVPWFDLRSLSRKYGPGCLLM